MKGERGGERVPAGALSPSEVGNFGRLEKFARPFERVSSLGEYAALPVAVYAVLLS